MGIGPAPTSLGIHWGERSGPVARPHGEKSQGTRRASVARGFLKSRCPPPGQAATGIVMTVHNDPFYQREVADFTGLISSVPLSNFAVMDRFLFGVRSLDIAHQDRCSDGVGVDLQLVEHRRSNHRRQSRTPMLANRVTPHSGIRPASQRRYYADNMRSLAYASQVFPDRLMLRH